MNLLIATIALLLQQALPSMQDIQASYDAANYPDTVKQINQVMPAATKSNSAYDKTKLLGLKGESLLHLKQWVPASDAFKASAALLTDEKEAAIAGSTAFLIRQSTNGKYQPKQPSTEPSAPPGKPEAIDITEAESRKKAFGALFNDQSKTYESKIAALEKGTTLPQLMTGIKQVGDLRGVELAATGSDESYKKMVSGLADHAGDLMNTALTTMSDRVEQIYKSANQAVNPPTAGDTRQVFLTRAGLTSTDKNNLNEIVKTAADITTACDAFGKATAGASASLKTASTAAAALTKRATQVLTTDYNNGMPNANPNGTGAMTPGVGTGTTGTGVRHTPAH